METPKRVLWFRAKWYGWGWYPSSWQGWLVTLVFALLLAFSVAGFDTWVASGPEPSEEAVGAALFLLWVLLLVISLMRICLATGEKPGWQWGRRD